MGGTSKQQLLSLVETQILFLALLDLLLPSRRGRLMFSLFAQIDPVANTLISKLSDAQPRVRDGAELALVQVTPSQLLSYLFGFRSPF